MRRAALSVVVSLLASIAGYASTTIPCTANCTTTVGTFTYLGNDSNGVSNWTVNVQTPVFFSTPITLNTATFFVKGNRECWTFRLNTELRDRAFHTEQQLPVGAEQPGWVSGV